LTCIAECSKAWYEKNREASLGKKAEYHALNKDKIKIRKIAYYKSNPDKLIRQSEMSRTYRKRNPVTAKASAKRYYLTNLNKIKEYGKAWTALNRDKKRVYKNNRRCREQSGRLSSDIVRRLLELQEGKCVSCKLPLGVNYHIDHIIPLVRGGLNIDSNVQLLHSTCNLQKGGKDPILYMQELGYLL
jgi:5-methylcytosine-specific restriction endonuclease McrA